MAVGSGTGTEIPAVAIHLLINVCHRPSRYGAEVNVL
jgi:hypothetical protein